MRLSRVEGVHPREDRAQLTRRRRTISSTAGSTSSTVTGPGSVSATATSAVLTTSGWAASVTSTVAIRPHLALHVLAHPLVHDDRGSRRGVDGAGRAELADLDVGVGRGDRGIR